LYELLTGETPFRGQTHLILQQIVTDEPRPPRKLNDAIPRDLETVVLKCLAKEPGRRYPTALELADDLQRWLDGVPVRARPVSTGERAWRWCRRNPAVAGLAAGFLLALLIGLVSVTLQWQRAEANATTAQRKEEEANKERDAVLALNER